VCVCESGVLTVGAATQHACQADRRLAARDERHHTRHTTPTALTPTSAAAAAAASAETDLVGTVDEWGGAFVDELDYRREAENARTFSAAIAETPLRNVVFSPPVVGAATTQRVLVTRWVDGEVRNAVARKDCLPEPLRVTARHALGSTPRFGRMTWHIRIASLNRHE
jgi:hypothetical protein